ncbi:MAG: nitroreductase [Alphaproteobacteria bacterium]|nr:nitroreductase [Alphaproteobacteria bacterium]
MNVTEAVRARKSVRAFLPKQVPDDTLRQILIDAARAPSGGNVQPWKTYVLTGDARNELVKRITDQWAGGKRGEGTEYKIYPDDLGEPYMTRRRVVGFKLYELAGVGRDDKVARMKQMFRNFELFDAPVCMIFTIDRNMGPPQWADLGMYIQTVALVAMDHGLETCMQEAWASWHKTLTETLSIPGHEMVFCGIAMGYEDTSATVNTLRSERAGLEDVKFFGFGK